MTRMIERWFPCAEVGEASRQGWGSGHSEKALFTWFATRPLAQAKAAVLTSLLPWPDEPDEQGRLQDLVRDSLTTAGGAQKELREELDRHYPDGASMLDPFSGRAVIPLEAARLGIDAWGIEYSPVATLAGRLLADYPLGDWSSEPPLPFGFPTGLDRLVSDVEATLEEVGDRWERSMAEFYPAVNGKQPWGYLWASTLPCQECGRRFPLTGSLVLRQPLEKKGDPGQSIRIEADRGAGTWRAVVHEGEPQASPTLVAVKGQRGKAAVCPFCSHVHPIALHTRLSNAGLRRDALLVAADIDDEVGKHFREPTDGEYRAAQAAADALCGEPDFAPGIPAVPDERIPEGNNHTVRASKYGAQTFGDLCNPRQTLGFVRLAATIDEVGHDLMRAGVSWDYAAALTGYAASVMVRKIRYSTRGARLQVMAAGGNKVGDIFVNESSVGFGYDHFEAGIGEGPATWRSVARGTLAVLRNQAARAEGRPATIQTGSVLSLALPDDSRDALVTDPPYDNMIDYSDASDLFYVWLKRALASTYPGLTMTADPHGVQEKTEEAIVKDSSNTTGDHRTREFYDRSMVRAFTEARRVVRPDGVVTIVFGHGDIDVWDRLLAALTEAGLVLTGSWPAQTEAGGKAGAANIITTLTMACRPAPENRPTGRMNEVDGEVRREVAGRMPLWEASNLATHDQLMAAVGPALEVVGRYSEVRDRRGRPLPLKHYLVLARQAVREAADIRIDGLPLETFDPLTRFALDWVRLYGDRIAPASEARWQALVSGLELGEVAGAVLEKAKAGGAEGMRIAASDSVGGAVDEDSPVIGVAFALAVAWRKGREVVAQTLADCGRGKDPHLWAALRFLSARLPESNADADAWTRMVRAEEQVQSSVRGAQTAREQSARRREVEELQGQFWEDQ